MNPEPEQVIAFTVPYLVPPSGNHYKYPVQFNRKGQRYSSGWVHYFLTHEAKAYYDAVAIFAQGRTVAQPKARYGVRIDVYLGPKQRGDFDNYWKCGLDAIVHCGVIHTDAAVDGEHSKCVVHKDDRSNPRTEYLITRLEN